MNTLPFPAASSTPGIAVNDSSTTTTARKRRRSSKKPYPVFPNRRGYWHGRTRREWWRAELMDCARTILRQEGLPIPGDEWLGAVVELGWEMTYLLERNRNVLTPPRQAEVTRLLRDFIALACTPPDNPTQ